MLIDTHGQPVDPFAPLGTCTQCDMAAWTTTAAGLLCPDHAGVLGTYNKNKALLDAAQEVCDALGMAEWSTPEHAEIILRDIIDFRWANLRDALKEAR
jgi:hypothetical protein